jgi:phosphate-selective porin
VRTTRLLSFIVLSAVAWPVAAIAQSPPADQSAPFHPTISVGGYLQGEFDGGAVGDTRFPSSNRFFLRRARLTAGGAALPTLTYRVQLDLAGGLGSASGVSASLTDGYVEWTRYAAAHVRFGQFKAPFGREWLVSSTQLYTVERTLATDRLTVNRQIGVSVLGASRDDRFGYAAGLFNGNGRNTTVNDNGHFMYVFRGTARPFRLPAATILEVGADAYWSRDTRLSMAKDFGLDSTPDSAAADNLFSGSRRGLGVDAHAERGTMQLDAEFLDVRYDQDSVSTVVTSRGWYLQPAAFVHRHVVQVVGRYERFRPDTAFAGNETTTWLAGVNYYARGTNAKLMADYLWVDSPNSPDAHAKVLAQLQVAF